MDESQRRVTEKNEEGPGRRLKLIAVLTLAAVAAAGYFAFDYSRTSPSGRPGGFFATGSTPGAESAAADAAKAPHDLPGGRRAENPRRLADDTTRPEELRPGYTMAELCAAGADGGSYACKTGSYDDGSLRPAARGAPVARAATKGYTISGRVLTAEGAGLGGITLVAAPERLAGEVNALPGKLRFWTVTDALGAYSLDGLPDGEYTIRSRTQGEYPAARIAARTGVDDADLVITPQLAVVAEGKVVDADGAPLDGVTVAPVLSGQASVATDDDGRFSLPVTVKPAVRSFALRFQRPGFQEATGEFDIASGAPLDVVLQPVEAWTSVRGTLRDAVGPLAGRALELRPQSGASYQATTDKEGRFAFPAVESPADYRLVALGGPDHEDRVEEVHVTTRMRELELVVPAYRFGRVRGHVANLDGEPVPSLELALRNAGSRSPNAVVRTDTDGDFEVPSAPAGRLVVASQSTPAILVEGLELEPGATLELPLVLDLGSHEIHGRVVDARGEPVTASRIVMQWSHESGGITTRTTRRAAADADGRFAFSRLGPGPHALTIEAPGFPAVTVEHDVSRGYDLTVQLKTDVASARAALATRMSTTE